MGLKFFLTHHTGPHLGSSRRAVPAGLRDRRIGVPVVVAGPILPVVVAVEKTHIMGICRGIF